jgi:hypothetical protein
MLELVGLLEPVDVDEVDARLGWTLATATAKRPATAIPPAATHLVILETRWRPWSREALLFTSQLSEPLLRCA